MASPRHRSAPEREIQCTPIRSAGVVDGVVPETEFSSAISCVALFRERIRHNSASTNHTNNRADILGCHGEAVESLLP
jgi:hypothetical protein